MGSPPYRKGDTRARLRTSGAEGERKVGGCQRVSMVRFRLDPEPEFGKTNHAITISLVSSVKRLEEAFPKWEISHMTTLVRADEKGRLCIRGTRKGEEYLVKAEKDGWWVVPVQSLRTPKKQKREWAGSKVSLVEHLTRLADGGLRLERSDIAKQRVPKCRF